MGNHAGAAELVRSWRSSGVAAWTAGFLASGSSHALSEKKTGVYLINSTSVHDLSARQAFPPATPELLQLLNS
jgi:hypothetical protein